MGKAVPYPDSVLEGESGQRTYEAPHTLQIAFPLGGIGAGCICLDGGGGMRDFSIRNKPATTAVPDRHAPGDAAFAVLHIKGKKPVTKLVEGPMPPERVYDQGLKAQGHGSRGCDGLPRFETCAFHGEFPFATVSLAHPDVPLSVSVTGFSPFIPLDDVNSGIPCAILEYTLSNPTRKTVDFEFSYHLSHLAQGESGPAGTRNAVIPGAGAFLYNEDPPGAERFGSASLTVVGHKPAIKAMWFRGGWFDSISALWRELSTGAFRANKGSNGVDVEGRNGASVLLAGTLKPGQSVTYPIVIAWYFPNCYETCGPQPAEPGCCGDGQACGPKPKWRPFYAGVWKDARDVARHVHKHYASLRARTQAFHDALFSTTLPSYVLDAVSANLAILRSPTVLRQENGTVWGWEGCFADQGCCPGSCDHVWNYAQALPHLFPQLERTLREQELRHSMDERGHVTFRSSLPDGPADHGFHAAADGQLGGIMKLYREWQISGDQAWLEGLYPLAKRGLDYCIATWDPDRTGLLVEPHHNTYDIEFWGPDGMCSSIYIGALSAMAAMADAVGDGEAGAEYRALAERGAAAMDARLFNGEYYAQEVVYKGLRDTSFVEEIASATAKSSEVLQLLKREGPKYQYGSGCLSDGVIGAWMARIYGIDTPMTQRNVKKTLAAIFRHNFVADLSDHACPQRPGFALGHEPGLLLCTWPRSAPPTLPFPYSDEVWTGIEYQVASHLIEEGLVKEGLTVTKAVRDRYDGRARNPWNEYECGSYYARAMSSYALLASLSGFRYSAADETLYLAPKLEEDPLRVFFSTATGWGTLTLAGDDLSIDLVEGKLPIRKVVLRRDGHDISRKCRVVARAGSTTRVAALVP